jgi:hypothetical protein
MNAFYKKRYFAASWSICRRLFALLYLACYSQVFAQDNARSPLPTFKTIRWEEDYSYLSEESKIVRSYFDPIKFIPLCKNNKSYLSVGGEMRYQYEYVDNANWGEGEQDKNGYLLQRYMLHTDFHFGRYLRIFAQLKSGIASGKEVELDPPDEDLLDIHQAFADLLIVEKKLQLTLRIGRQEMMYGSSRLVSVREAPNVRQSFDAGKLIFKFNTWQADAFFSRPVETNRGFFDDGSDRNVQFFGLYTSKKIPSILKGNVDLYYFGLKDKKASFQQGQAKEMRHSVGIRLWSKEALLNYNLEAVYQLGTFGEGKIRAWTASAELNYGLNETALEPTLNLKTEIISGDRNPENPDLQTFNPLFPKGAYFGQVALIGPANLIDLHPSFIIHPAKNLELVADWDFFWRESLNDGLYSVPYVLIRENSGSRAAYIGDQLTLEADWQISRHLQLEGFCTFFRAGEFLKQSGESKNIVYLSSRVTFKF